MTIFALLLKILQQLLIIDLISLLVKNVWYSLGLLYVLLLCMTFSNQWVFPFWIKQPLTRSFKWLKSTAPSHLTIYTGILAMPGDLPFSIVLVSVLTFFMTPPKYLCFWLFLVFPLFVLEIRFCLL